MIGYLGVLYSSSKQQGALLSYRVKPTAEVGEGRLLPDSILLSIFLAHCMKASSTFSPVSALVSRNISSESGIKEDSESWLEDSNLQF